MRLVRDVTASLRDWSIVLLVGLLAVGLPYGYLIGMLAGIGVDQLMKRGWVTLDVQEASASNSTCGTNVSDV